MTPRELDDDPLSDREAELEARFRDLEHEAEIEKLRAQMGSPPRPSPPPGAAPQADPGPDPTDPAAPDPLADLKAAVDGQTPSPPHPGDDAQRERPAPPRGTGERVLLVLCPSCESKNRVSLARLRTLSPKGSSGFTPLEGGGQVAAPNPLCGRCRQELSFPKP